MEQAVTNLGQPDGFLKDLNVRIPMPENLKKVEKTLRSLRQDRLADEFVTTMNRAAEPAVPEAASVLVQAVQQMTVIRLSSQAVPGPGGPASWENHSGVQPPLRPCRLAKGENCLRQRNPTLNSPEIFAATFHFAFFSTSPQRRPSIPVILDPVSLEKESLFPPIFPAVEILHFEIPMTETAGKWNKCIMHEVDPNLTL